jgi:hypothetical protein
MPLTGWRTLREEIRKQLRKPTTSHDDIGRALCEAITFNRKLHIPEQNEARFSFLTTADTYLYAPGAGASMPTHTGVPTDLLRIVGDLYYQDAGDTSSRRPLKDKSVEWLERYRELGSSWSSSITAGETSYFGWWDEQLIVIPKPTATGDIISGRYISDTRAPYYEWDGTAWDFYTPAAAALNPDTYTSIWLEGELGRWTKQRALYYLWSEIYQGEDSASSYASKALTSWLETKESIMTKAQSRQPVKTVRGYL